MVGIRQLKSEEIFLRYKELKTEIDKALFYSDGEWTSQQIIEAAVKEPLMFHVWEVLINDKLVAIGTTRVISYNNFTSLHIITLGGSDIYDDLPETLNEFANMISEYEHIDYLEFTGRKGFVKQAGKAGWEEKYVTMRKNLKENK